LRARLDSMGLTVRVGTPAEAEAELKEQKAKIEAALKASQ
jgi:hypothetical protein